jgi:hypothetical protein
MPAQTITALPTAPSRTDAPAVFTTEADAFVAALATFRDELVAFGTYMDGVTAGATDWGDIVGTLSDQADLQAALDAKADATDLALMNPQEWTPNFSTDGDLYIPAVEAMTIDQGSAEIGTGTITFEKSTAAAPGTFASTTLPAALEAGAWLHVNAASVTGFVAIHLVRTA